MKKATAKKHADGACDRNRHRVHRLNEDVEMLIIPIGTSVSIHGEAGGVVTAHATIEGLQICRHRATMNEVAFLTQES